MTPFLDDGDVKIYVGDARETLQHLDAESVDCVITSPPYFNLRDYGTGTWEGGDNPDCDHAVRTDARVESSTLAGGKGSTGHQREGFKDVCPRCGARRVDRQVGLERTPQAYVAAMVEVFREVHRVLAPHGTLWLNLGDSYSSSSTYNTPQTLAVENGWKQEGARPNVTAASSGIPAKNLLGIPWRVALALQDDGWILRSEIIWAKANVMPESVTDRPTRAHEHVFMLAKSPRYFYDIDAVREPIVSDRDPSRKAKRNGAGHLDLREGGTPYDGTETHRNPRTIWEIPTRPFTGAHFAVFPPELVRRALLAGCPLEVCAECGRPRERIVEKGEPELQADTWSATGAAQYDDGAGGYELAEPSSTLKHVVPRKTIGWTDCGCARGLKPDDLEVILTPTGDATDDPTMEVGRRGLARPRSEDGGTRPITRYEQRGYAAQLREWSESARRELQDEFGITDEAWAHYVRTDRAGARPLPPDALAASLERGWIDPVELPEARPGTWRPGVVLDPFMGSGTTGIVARQHGRHAVGIELNPEYADMAAGRLAQQALPIAG